jgi:hypothetical protein
MIAQLYNRERWIRIQKHRKKEGCPSILIHGHPIGRRAESSRHRATALATQSRAHGAHLIQLPII